MPQETSYPEEVQVAFFIFGQLKDSFDGMSGTYLGKEWSSCEFFLNLHGIEDPKVIVYFMKLIERIVVKNAADEAERKRKQEERKSKTGGGGKTYTHNVKG